MKKFFLFIFLVSLIIAFISILIVHDNLVDEKVTLIVELINVSQVFISIYIAYLLYDRFGTSKKILDKQSDIILEYLEEIKKLKIQIYFIKNDKVHIEMSGSISKNLYLFRSQTDLQRTVLVKSNYFSSDEKIKRLYELINHPLFPISIKEELEIFNYQVLTSTFSNKKENFAFMSFENETEFELEDWRMPGNHNEESFTLEQFTYKIENLLNTLENWVNKESSIKVKLNF
ncbi:hypothetical protein [Flavobacterium sp. LAR06]|uniref:hypothetical protein n=1 Tax=Flavobacterium sp. LAR06 TaxID=3064897 RepID=UPI0035C17214